MMVCSNVTIGVFYRGIGVCDCCDGSDEVDSPFSMNCPNTCEQDLAARKKTALAWYRTVQAALHTKADQVSALKRQKLKENKSYETLKSEKKELETMLITMKYLLSKEIKREKELRWRLLRDREQHCASGHDAACNYFFSGYYYDDELQGEGYPVELLGPQKKLPYEYTYKEQEYMNKLGTVERVRWSICPVKTLLPDDDARLFGKIGEYLNYMATPGAKVSQDRTILVIRRHTVLGPFLEYGEKGHILAGVVASEMLGLLLSPVIGVGYALHYGYTTAARYLWDAVKSYSSYKGIESPTDVISSSGGVLEQLANLIIEADIPGSQVDTVLSYLDYNRYSAAIYVVDSVFSLLYYPVWVYDIAVRSPSMYFDYYYNGRNMNLPPRRQACMLRNAMSNAEKEIQKLQEQITAEEELRDALVAVKENNNDRNKRSKGGKKGNKQQLDRPKVKLVKMDYGVDGAFEVLKDVCLEKTVDDYDYNFCFFDEVKQGKHTSMGMFSNWGTSKTAPSLPGIDLSELYNNPGETLSNAANQLLEAVADPEMGAQYLQTTSEWIASQTSTLLSSTQSMIMSLASNGTVGGTAANAKLHGNGTRMLDEVDRFYSYQWYEGGTVCQTKPDKQRTTLVEMRCDVKNEIVEVRELETCAYKMIVSTPIVCTSRTEERSLAELDRLGVFGFTTKK